MVQARSTLVVLWREGHKHATLASHRELYDAADGRVVCPVPIMAPIHNIILIFLLQRCPVFQLWLNFNSYVSPTHPPICTGLL